MTLDNYRIAAYIELLWYSYARRHAGYSGHLLYNSAKFVHEDGLEVSLVGHPGEFTGRSVWRTLLVVLAVCCISLSVATRYVVIGSDSPATKAVKCQSLDAKRQHLLGDGLQWTAPAATVMFFVAPKPSARIINIAVPLHELYSEDWLYNRPPPAC
jgi:hypothetical protein